MNASRRSSENSCSSRGGKSPAARSSTLLRSHSLLLIHLSFSEPQIPSYKEGEDYRDYAVHREEGGIEAGEIVGLHERMFVEEQQADGHDAGYRQFAEGEGWEQSDQQKQHHDVKGASDPESAVDADVARDGV